MTLADAVLRSWPFDPWLWVGLAGLLERPLRWRLWLLGVLGGGLTVVLIAFLFAIALAMLFEAAPPRLARGMAEHAEELRGEVLQVADALRRVVHADGIDGKDEHGGDARRTGRHGFGSY